ncbi:IPT/TIG domain-containing protein [Chitinophaga lutea]
MKKFNYKSALCALMVFSSCAKESVNSDGKNPYGDPVLPSITFAEKGALSPAFGYVNDEVVLKGKGFLTNKDKMTILFNGIQAPILEVRDTSVKVRIPEFAATGLITAQIGQEFYYGPNFRVYSALQMDTVYPSFRGANNVIRDIIELPSSKFLIGGIFTDYDNSSTPGGVNRIARINLDGTLDKTLAYGWGTGPAGEVNAAAYIASEQKYLVAGSFARYGRTDHCYNIARVNNNGRTDSTEIVAPSTSIFTASALKGGFRGGAVRSIHVRTDGKIIATGNFNYYVSPNFNLTTVELGIDSMHLDSIPVFNIARLHEDGELDSTFNYDLVNHRSKPGPNGYITKSELLPDGKILIIGTFSTYNGQPAPRIARLNEDGSLDASFKAGSGADQAIVDFVRQPDGKILIAGNFNRFNGVAAIRMARLTADGALDPTFNSGEGPNGPLAKVGVLPTGEILVAGSFRKFSGLLRNSFVVLNSDGSLHKQYNSNGGFQLDEGGNEGSVSDFLVIPSQKMVLVVGSFKTFDYRPANRILKLKFP